MNVDHLIKRSLPGLLAATLFSLPGAVQADMEESLRQQQDSEVLLSYRRLLPLEGGSNFRDLGGYQTEDGKTVRRGLLFRSGVMTWLSDADQAFLAQLGMASIVDLRSNEELELFPNHWARQAGIGYHHHAYSIMDLLGERSPEDAHANAYSFMPQGLKPQLRQYFDLLVEGKAPLVVNCSAGQDRTGFTAALLLSALGVPRETIIEDYLLSSDFRRPRVERGEIDLTSAAQSNAFARLMLSYGQQEPRLYADPLFTATGEALIVAVLEQLEEEYGSIQGYLQRELGLSEADLARLKTLYLQ